MKISFKIPAIAALSGLVLCAGAISAYAENAAANKQDYSPGIDIALNDGTVFTVPENQLEKCLTFIDILQNDPDNINIQHVEASPLTYYGLSDGTLLPVLVEYLEECAPYIDELLLIDEVRGIENIPDFTTKEAIDRILSMSVEEFRGNVLGADGGTVGVEEREGSGDVIEHRGGFWHFADNDIGESGGDKEAPETHYYPDNGTDGGEVGVTPRGEFTPDGGRVGVTPSGNLYSYDTDEASAEKIGIYRGDGRVCRCE